MMTTDEIVFVVDDNVSVRKSLARLIASNGLKVKTFASAREYLKQGPYERPSCLVLDVRMPEMSGLDLQNELASAKISVPIIFITGYGNVPMSVKAMKDGAVDFIEKPFDDETLINVIKEAIERDRKATLNQIEINEIQKRVDSLTPREYEVFALVVQGLLNKQIASELGNSEKTVKIHRGRVMEKMQADSLAALVRMFDKIGMRKTKVL